MKERASWLNRKKVVSKTAMKRKSSEFSTTKDVQGGAIHDA